MISLLSTASTVVIGAVNDYWAVTQWPGWWPVTITGCIKLPAAHFFWWHWREVVAVSASPGPCLSSYKCNAAPWVSASVVISRPRGEGHRRTSVVLWTCVNVKVKKLKAMWHWQVMLKILFIPCPQHKFNFSVNDETCIIFPALCNSKNLQRAKVRVKTELNVQWRKQGK